MKQLSPQQISKYFLKNPNILDISENFQEYKLIVKGELTNDYTIQEFEDLISSLQRKHQIIITIEYSDSSIFQFNSSNKSNIEQKFEELIEQTNLGEVNLTIKIVKLECNELDIYDEKQFLDYLKTKTTKFTKENLGYVVRSFLKYKSIYFIYLEISISLINDSFRYDKLIQKNIEINGQNVTMSISNSLTLNSLMCEALSPELILLLQELSILVFLLYISDEHSINEDEIHFQFDKNLKTSFHIKTLSDLKLLHDDISELLLWLSSSTEDTINEKISILNSVIRGRITYFGDCKNNALYKLFQSIATVSKSAHSIYLDRNFDKYVNTKTKTIEYLVEFSNKFKSVSDGFLKNIAALLIAQITFMLTSLIPSVLNSTVQNQAISHKLSIVANAISAAIVILSVISYCGARSSLLKYERDFIKIKSQFSTLLHIEELDLIFDEKSLEEEHNYFSGIMSNILFISFVIVLSSKLLMDFLLTI